MSSAIYFTIAVFGLEHQCPGAGFDARPVHGVEPDRHRLGEGGVAGVEAVGHLEAIVA